MTFFVGETIITDILVFLILKRKKMDKSLKEQPKNWVDLGDFVQFDRYYMEYTMEEI
jgi:hypothetical protein